MKIYLIISFFLISCATAEEHFDEKLKLAEDAGNRKAFREAVDFYKEALAIEPEVSKDSNTYLRLAEIYYQVGDYKSCIQTLKSQESSADKKFDRSYLLGECYRVEKDFENALVHLKTANTLNGNEVGPLRSLAWIHLKMNNVKRAEVYAKRLLKVDSKDDENHIVFLKVDLKLKKFKEVQKHIRNRKWSKEYSAVLLGIMGDSYMGLHKLNTAEQYFKRALRINPFLVSALYGLGNCYNAKGDSDKAFTYYKKLNALVPDEEWDRPQDLTELVNAREF